MSCLPSVLQMLQKTFFRNGTGCANKHCKHAHSSAWLESWSLSPPEVGPIKYTISPTLSPRYFKVIHRPPSPTSLQHTHLGTWAWHRRRETGSPALGKERVLLASQKEVARPRGCVHHYMGISCLTHSSSSQNTQPAGLSVPPIQPRSICPVTFDHRGPQ